MKLTHYIYTMLPLLLTACEADEVVHYVYSVGEKDNAICLSAGVLDGGDAMQTRATTADPTYVAFTTQGTKVALRVDGYWKGKTDNTVSKTTTGTIGTADGTKNPLTLDPSLYWDDYGTADPNNIDDSVTPNKTGREKGLAIYGVAVDGETTAPAFSSTDTWTSLSWELNTNGSYVLKKDLLCSNNLSDNQTPGRLTFDNRNTEGKSLLVFKHVLSKITFEVTAGTGFTATNGFQSAPEVHLTNNDTWKSTLSDYTSNNYCLTSGTVNVLTATATSTTSSAIKMQQIGAEGTKYTYHALVYPGTALGGIDNNTIIALVKADDNVYKIPADKIRTALTNAGGHTDYKTLAGHHYTIKVTITKQGLNVTASVTDWVNHDIAADAKINLTAEKYGEDGNNSLSSFDLYLKENSSEVTAYQMHSTVKRNSSNAYETNMYWPTTTKTYHLRALVDPATGSPSLKDNSSNYKLFSNTDSYAVSLNRGNDYLWGTTWDGTNAGADISPTSGNVRMQFYHVMSQVTVVVQTTTGDDKVDLAGSKCVITGLNNKATLNMHTGAVTLPTGTGVTSDHTMYDLSSGTDAPAATGYTSIQIPQAAFAANDGIKFVITLKDGTVYELPLSDNALITGDNKITQWESRGSYKYELTLKKQAINVTSQITDWNTLQTAGGEIQL